jgi:hypothetical protein
MPEADAGSATMAHYLNRWQTEWGFLREESPGGAHDALEKFKQGPQYRTIMGLAQRPGMITS